jgi:integrase
MASIKKRINKDGSETYRVQVRMKGYPPQNATFPTKTKAKHWAQQTESAIREGRYFHQAEAKKRTFAEMVDRYVETILPLKPKSISAQKQQLLWWKEEFQSLVLAEVTQSLIAEKRDKLKQLKSIRGGFYSPATVNRFLAVLSHAFSVAIKEWEWTKENPVLRVRKMQEPSGRIRFLSDEERKRLLKVCMESNSRYLFPIVVLALSSGARKSEILGLRWRDVDFERNQVVLHETKNKERRTFPLRGMALDLVSALDEAKATDGFLFPGKNPNVPYDIRRPWENALKKAEFQDFKFHDLRHSAASYLAMTGASLVEIAAILGHKTLRMVKRYTHLSDDHMGDVVARMNEKIFS